MLAGCSGNQQKLEECMNTAGQKYSFKHHTTAEQLGCATVTKDAAPNASPFCSVYERDLKALRLEEEERCVKLYK